MMEMAASTHTHDTRTLLLKAARSTFAKKGYDGTTVKEIADAAGVNVSLVSYHFSGKEGLYRACLEETGLNSLPQVQQILQPAKSIEEFRVRLELFTESFIQFHLEEREACSILYREAELDFAAAREVFQQIYFPLFDTIRTFFSSAQRNDFIRKELDLDVILSVVIRSCESSERRSG
jgi:AcrR family transcriptional regulator